MESSVNTLFSNPDILLLLVQIALGGIASFFAILSWSYTRHSSWLFAVLGILSIYASILYKALRFFGLLPTKDLLLLGAPLSTLLSENIPILLFIIASIIYIRENR